MKKIIIVCMVLHALLSARSAMAADSVRFRYAASLYVDERGGSLNKPEGTGCRGQNIVIADTGNGQLLKYVYQQGMFKFEGQVKIPELTRPAKVQISSKGEIFSLDEKQLRIVRVGAGGTYAGYVQPAGLPAPGIWTPRSFALDGNDNIYVLDIASERVLVLDPAGNYVREIKYPKAYGFFSDITVNAAGTVFALDTVDRSLYSAPSNRPALELLAEPLKQYADFPTALVSDSSGLLFIVDRNNGVILAVNESAGLQGKNLSRGWNEGLLRYPEQICVSDQSTLFVADRENNRIQVFTIAK